jgi:DnaJ homolog subfamily C member 19
MIWLALGLFALFLFLGGLRAFEQASVTTIKSFFLWLLALGGISLALMLILTGREGIALGALVLAGPVIWKRFRTTPWASNWTSAFTSAAGTPPPRAGGGPMTLTIG